MGDSHQQGMFDRDRGDREVLASAPGNYPPPGPKEVAEAKAIINKSKSETLAGMQELLLESHRHLMKVGVQYHEDARTYLADTKQVGRTIAEVNVNAIGMLESYGAIAKEARKPQQPRPTASETYMDGFKHLSTEIRKLLESTLSGNEPLKKHVAEGLHKLVQKGNEIQRLRYQ